MKVNKRTVKEGKFTITIISNEPSEKAKQDFNKAFNRLAEQLSMKDV
ncbi:hypothetical protein ACTWQB_15720 [Piscibacillus sp. B03]